MISKRFTQIPAGQVQTFLCANVNEELLLPELSQTAESDDLIVVTHVWETLPSHEALLDDILQALSKVALAAWPVWYGEAFSTPQGNVDLLESEILNQSKIQELHSIQPKICLPWAKSAIKHCHRGSAPALALRYPRSLQVEQLALAISAGKLLVVLATSDLHPNQHRLLSLARAATWIAEETNSRVAVLIPQEYTKYKELDSILYGAVPVPIAPQKPKPPVQEDSKHIIWPVQGRPHPFSPGEQLLCNQLLRDNELSNLFSFNQHVETSRGSRYLVDLLWADGRIVIEVDGYRHHGNQFAFIEDRKRDYELLISGYNVLRLPHEEVITDVEIALEKIRDVVRYRRNQPAIQSEAHL